MSTVEDMVEAEIVRVDLSSGARTFLKTEVAVESPINVYINNEQVATLFATPTKKKELAVGHLLGEGIFRNIHEIQAIKVKKNEVRLAAAKDVKMRLRAAKTIKIVETSCGSTDDFYRLLDRMEKPLVKSKYTVSVDEIRRMTRELNSHSTLFKRGGAVHAAAIFEKSGKELYAEDVGRHNATDKVIGAAILESVDLSRSVIIGTGRQPASMILKISRIGIPISISVRGPIYSGIHVAKKTGVTLACFGRTPGITVYTHPERITGPIRRMVEIATPRATETANGTDLLTKNM